MHAYRFHPTVLVLFLGLILAFGGSWRLLPSADAQPALADGKFELAHAQLYDKDVCETVVYHTTTGQSWYRIGTAWNKISEPAPLPRGDYEVQLIPSRQDGYRTFRLDKQTGQTWYIKDLKWVPFEPLGK